jgi:hypothetical protein
MRIGNRAGGLIIFCFCIGLVIYGIIKADSLLKDNKVINGGHIDYCQYGARGNAGRLHLNFTFHYKGKIIKGSTMLTTSQISVGDCNFYLRGKYFPVIFQTNDPNNSELLITQRDFKRYGYNFPDSLEWAIQYVSDD